MNENPQLQWASIRKVYTVVTFEILLNVVAALVVFVRPIPQFLLSETPCHLDALIPMILFREKHPGNLILLVLFMICISFALGLACSSKSGKFILEAVVLTAIVVVGLTPCTLWAAKRGHNFNFLGPFLFAAILVLMVYCLLQIFLPPGRVGKIIYCCIAAIVCSGFIVYDTDNLIKHYTYDEHIITSISLYLDIANLFSALLNLLS